MTVCAGRAGAAPDDDESGWANAETAPGAMQLRCVHQSCEAYAASYGPMNLLSSGVLRRVLCVHACVRACVYACGVYQFDHFQTLANLSAVVSL